MEEKGMEGEAQAQKIAEDAFIASQAAEKTSMATLAVVQSEVERLKLELHSQKLEMSGMVPPTAVPDPQPAIEGAP